MAPRCSLPLLVTAIILTGAPVVAHLPLQQELDRLTRRIEAHPNEAHLYVVRAELYRAAGGLDNALADLEKARTLDPEALEVDLHLARLLFESDRLAAARDSIERYLSHSERDQSAPTLSTALVLEAQILDAAGRKSEAVRAYSAALDHDPSAGPAPYLRRARLLAEMSEAAASPSERRSFLGAALTGLYDGLDVLGPVPALSTLTQALETQLGSPHRRPLDRLSGHHAREPAPLVATQPPRGDRSPTAHSQAVTTPPMLTRGPYLQRGTPSSMTIRWRTDQAVSSRVAYGSSAEALTESVEDATLRTEHELTVEGLVTNTHYFYSVGTTVTTLAGGDADHTFWTAPEIGSTPPLRLWVIGDSGTANAGAAAVRDAYLDLASGTRTDLWLMLGDNAYTSGTDEQYQSAVFDMYPTLLRTIPLWSTLGNHDTLSADSATQSGVYFDVFTLPTQAEAGGVATGTEAYYSFDYGNVHFVCLDSSDSDLDPSGDMLQWLSADLAATSQDWIIAYWHHPPYTKGSHDSDNPSDSGGRLFAMRENALPIPEAAGVDLVLTGHSHSYERSFLVDGHYGTSDTLTPAMIIDSGDGNPTSSGAYYKSATTGAVYAVAGSSGQAGAVTQHPIMSVALSELGSMVLDIEDSLLRGRFLRETGAIEDEFALVKGLRPSISVGDVQTTEGNSTTELEITVSLSAVTPVDVTVEYATIEGTAHSVSDYQSASDVVTIAAGQVSAPITVFVAGDLIAEDEESFTVLLSQAKNAALLDTEVLVIIDDDDAGRLFADGFETGSTSAWSRATP